MRRGASTNVIVAQSMALALAVAGAWALGVRPLCSRLDLARSELEGAQAETAQIRASLDTDSLPAQNAIRTISDHTTRLQSLCNASSDPSVVYDTIGRMAQQHGVRVERMEPKRVAVAAAPAGSARVSKHKAKAKDADHDPAPEIEAFGFQIDATGSYSSVAALIDAIERDTGLSKVLSFRLTPSRGSDGTPRVRAIIETAHYGLDRVLTHVSAKGDQ